MKMYGVVEVHVFGIGARGVKWLALLHPTLLPEEYTLVTNGQEAA
jgi:hypothetical protein